MPWMLLVAATASAACDPPFDINTFLLGLDAAEQALVASDPPRAQAVVDTLHDEVKCLRDPVHPRHLVRYGRVRAVLAYLARHDQDVSYWGQLALLDRGVRWPEGFPSDHPVRELLTLLAKRAPQELPERGLEVPDGGGVLVDGTLVQRPVAAPEAPHLVQIMAADGRLTATYWQDGTMWDPAQLDDTPEPTPIPRRYAAPYPSLDPYEPVVLSDRELQRREELQLAADAARQDQEEQLERALAKQQARAERRERRRARREGVREVAAPLEPPRAPSIGVEAGEPVFVENTLPRRDLLERGSTLEACRDPAALEPRSMVGRLTDAHILCLQSRLGLEDQQTERSRMSRMLMADAWAKGDPHRWEAALRRHLESIDRSDADLCFIFAVWLASRGPEEHEEALRWTRAALENAHQWEGERRVDRMDALHRVNAFASLSMWLRAEERALTAPTPEHRQQTGYWRNKTKNLAREWLQFASEAGVETSAAFELCLSAAGTVAYCEVG